LKVRPTPRERAGEPVLAAEGRAGLSELERQVCEHIARGEPELVELLRALIAFDTVTHVPGAPARQEAALQRHVAERLARHGAEVTVGEPDDALVAGHPMIPAGFSFAGRPQLAGRFAGMGGGRRLLLCGHVDVVDVEPREAWSVDPFDAVVRDGAVWGRGACDMKGGVACMILAAEALAELRVPLAGDLVVNTVTEEESTGAGGLVSARTLRADAAIVPEPSALAVWVACRGSLLPGIVVEGRAGHAGIAPRHPDDGGAVNAIEKAAYLVEAIRRLREDWALRPRHPYLSPADVVPTMIAGGEWAVSHPARCRLDCHIEYLPDQADERGAGSRVEREFEAWIARAAAADPWLRDHPPRIEWQDGGWPPAEVSPAEPVVEVLLGAQRGLGRRARLGGLDNWHDGATLIVEAGIPAVCYGPGDIGLAHGADEHVPIAELVACAQGIALAAIRFCGIAP
jgi:acetylornithine deacetylase